jgi:DNA-binding NarL/FixJ family response regulator
MGVANMFDRYRYRDRFVVAELDATMAVDDHVDIVLYDSFAQPESDHHEIGELVANPRARRVMFDTWNFHPNLIAGVRQHGAHGYLSETFRARELVAVLEAVHTGEVVISDIPPRGRSAVGVLWPGRGEGLSDRESEILALITQGKSNTEVAR